MTFRAQLPLTLAGTLLLGVWTGCSTPEPQATDPGRWAPAPIAETQPEAGGTDSMRKDLAPDASPEVMVTEAPVVSAPSATIHARREMPAAPRPGLTAWSQLQPLYDRAEAAADRLEFARAEQLFRELRDAEATPQSMRRRFHQKAAELGTLRYSMKQVMQRADVGDFQGAWDMVQTIVAKHESVPVAELLPLLPAPVTRGVRLPR